MADPTMDRKSEHLELTPETQATIWKDAANQSAFMQLAQKIPLPGAGVRVPIIVGEPQAAWVGERGEIPKSGVTFEKKDMIPYKIAVIMPFSNEFKRDYQALYTQISQMGPSAIAKAFDQTVMGTLAKPGEAFDTLEKAERVSLGSASKSVWNALNTADDKISAVNGALDGWALAPQGRSILRQTTDNNGRPLFLNGTDGADVATILGSPTHISRGIHVDATETGGDSHDQHLDEVVGVAGEFASAAWGAVSALDLSVSEQASLKIDGQQVNLWENDMFAVRIKMTVGFRIRDIHRFVLLTK